MRVPGSSLGWNEALVFFDSHQISVYLVEHTQPGISPPVLKTSPVHGAKHILRHWRYFGVYSSHI